MTITTRIEMPAGDAAVKGGASLATIGILTIRLTGRIPARSNGVHVVLVAVRPRIARFGDVVTIREMVTEIQVEVRDTDLSPMRAAELQSKLSALCGNVTTEIREAEFAFNQVLLRELAANEKANRAKIVASGTQEWLRLREGKDTLKLVDTMIASLKYLQRAAEKEIELSR